MINITNYTVTKEGTTVYKHGSHDQKTHAGGKGGKGGAGASSGGGSSQSIEDAKEDLSNNILGAEKVLNNTKDRNTANNARGTIRGFKDVKNALGDKNKLDKVRLKRNSLAAKVMSGPLAVLTDSYSEDTGYINAVTSALARYGNL